MQSDAPFVRRSLIVLGAALALLVAWTAADWYAAEPISVLQSASFVGRESCIKCHQGEFARWQGSHHDRAMEVATDETVLGDFDNATFSRLGVETRFFRAGDKFMVHTEGPDGEFRDYQIKYTFGIEPLQQYMVEFPDGRVQVLRESWDTERNEWFFVTPGDAQDSRIEHDSPLHWTGLGQNWNTMCAECHSTDYHKKYDLATDSYHSTFNEIDVSCEACHGPGSVHVELAEGGSLFWDRNVGYGLVNTMKTASNRPQIETCAPCHSRRAQIHPNYHAGESYFDHFVPSLLRPGVYHADGQILDEVYVYGSFVQSKMYHENVRCSDCHDPHSLRLKYDGNRLCAQCHQPGKYDTPNHHRHVQAEDGAAETQCVSCHMPMRVYMNIDGRRDHSFRVPRPDLSDAVGTPNACNDCHDAPGEDAAWAAEVVREWYGEKRPDDRRWVVAIAAGQAGAPAAGAALREVVKDRDVPDIVQATALELLAQYPAEENLKTLNRALDADNPLLRSAAVRGLPLSAPFATAAINPAFEAAAYYHWYAASVALAAANHALEAAANPWGQTCGQFVAEVAPLLDDNERSVRLAATNRMVDAAQYFANPEFRAAFDESLVEYRGAQQMHLDRAPAHIQLAMLALRLDKPREAIAEMREAIAREPYLTGPRGELARLLEAHGGDASEVRQRRMEEADLLKRDAALLPGDPSPHFRRGRLLYLLDDWDEARREFVKACRLGPDDYQSWMMLALICEKQQRFEQAVAALERMVQLQPRNPQAMMIYRRMQQTINQQNANSGSPDSQPPDGNQGEPAEADDAASEIERLREASEVGESQTDAAAAPEE